MNIKTSEYNLTNWTIYDDPSDHFGLKIADTMICIYCHQIKAPNISEDESYIISLGGIPLNN